MKTNMAAVVVTTALLHLGNFFWTVLNGLKLKCLDISIVFLGLFASKVNSGVIVWINRLAKVNGILQLLTEHPLTRVSRHLQKEETGVGFRQVVVWGRVFVKHLKWKTRKILSLSSPLYLLYFLVNFLQKALWELVTWNAKLFTATLVDNLREAVEKMSNNVVPYSDQCTKLHLTSSQASHLNWKK